MTDERPPTPEDRWRGGGCPADLLARRSFLRGTVAAGLVGAAGGSLLGGDEALADSASGDGARTSAIPFHGAHQAGIATPPQPIGAFASFDVTASGRAELTDLFRTLTRRARSLTAGGTLPKAPPRAAPPDTGILGPDAAPDDLTITVAVGATLFGRYGLAARKPAQLVTMSPFAHDDLDPALSHGDILVQLCAEHRDTTVHALLDILAHTNGAMRQRWRIHCQRNPPRPDGIPRDWFGFKDGISNPDTTNTAQLNQLVWTQPRTTEPVWATGGTYQVVRIVHFDLEKWQEVPVAQQERIFGRRKVSGAPMYAVSDNTSDDLDPIYTNDPQGLITPLHSHVRLANPQTPQTASTSSILRRSYDYDRSPDVHGGLDLGHAFCCFQRELDTYITMQNRLEDEMLVPYISPRGGGYFFALPGVRDDKDYYARGLLT
ncbi:Dyp-type peroxidase [Actinoallomurus purpureus]|uniref:Dyp-type peroxidase n=1 Tax=Actinoallomurus purpureus TaxID=478114 RepID=UPI00209339D2|nr:Dyp-type peroxidase [Actinoallomurus purpureus]MCO6006541.1 Dyp-type peroxidase [Actinoallomurus purpureus]